jgi:hypothetical protein
MQWTKLGHVYSADGSARWRISRAYLPTPLALDEETIRVYIAFLDADLIGRVGFVDVAAFDPRRIVRVSESPVLDVGAAGAFDEHGVTPSSIVRDGDALHLYYFGWQRARDVPYLLFGGLAVSEDGGETFTRASSKPVLPPVDGERICRSAPTVLRWQNHWRAWYVSADAWMQVAGQLLPTYEIRTATSRDGIRWEAPSAPAVARSSDNDEFGLGRPFVRPDAAGFQMWYSIRSRSRAYRIGYATSPDGRSWTRRDNNAGIDVSARGWDSEMVCFAAVLASRYGTYLFYNGNGYGQSGFGVAVCNGAERKSTADSPEAAGTLGP